MAASNSLKGCSLRRKVHHMATMTCTAKVREDGALVIPRTVRKELGLQRGDTVEVVVRKRASRRRSVKENSLYEIVALGKGGPPDGAENHDKYLYGKRTS
jgi:AbrB family looped-hinge helix DNA binding protein